MKKGTVKMPKGIIVPNNGSGKKAKRIVKQRRYSDVLLRKVDADGNVLDYRVVPAHRPRNVGPRWEPEITPKVA